MTVRGTAALSSHDVTRLAGCSYRQLDYWARAGAIVPTQEARGCGSARGWSVDDAALARAFYVLVSHGATIDVLAELRFAIQLDPGLWDSVVLVARDGRVARLGETPVMDGWLVNLVDARHHVRHGLLGVAPVETDLIPA